MYIVEEGNIAIITCTSNLDLGGWQQLLRQVNELDCPAVVDTRTTDTVLTELDAYLLAARARKLPALSTHRTAFVTANESHGYTGFFATCSRDRGLRIRTFDNPDSATDWALSSTVTGAA